MDLSTPILKELKAQTNPVHIRYNEDGFVLYYIIDDDHMKHVAINIDDVDVFCGLSKINSAGHFVSTKHKSFDLTNPTSIPKLLEFINSMSCRSNTKDEKITAIDTIENFWRGAW